MCHPQSSVIIDTKIFMTIYLYIGWFFIVKTWERLFRVAGGTDVALDLEATFIWIASA